MKHYSDRQRKCSYWIVEFVEWVTGQIKTEHMMGRKTNREERSLHHVAIVAKFLNDDKSKTSLKK